MKNNFSKNGCMRIRFETLEEMMKSRCYILSGCARNSSGVSDRSYIRYPK